jgi:hypothetical protein
MEQKKPTKKQLEKKLKEATVFVDKAEKSIYLADICVGIYISKFETVLSTNFHRHVWENINSVGYSGVYVFLNSFVDICLNRLSDITCKTKEGNVYYSFGKLLEIYNLSDDEVSIIRQFNMFNCSIHDGIYSVGNKDVLTNAILLINYYFVAAKVDIIENSKGKDITLNDYVRDLSMELFRKALNVEFEKIDKELVDKINKDIKEVWMDGYHKIEKIITDNGGKMIDTIAIPKQEQDEANDLNELTK